MKPIISMGHFTAIGMRTSVQDPTALVVNTCGGNDTANRGTEKIWTWANPTNRALSHEYGGFTAVSVECLWQGTKIFQVGGEPDVRTLGGEWRRGKAKRPIGAWGGVDRPLLTTPGEARRAIYIPAFKCQFDHWMRDPIVEGWVEAARNHTGPIYLRDFDTGRGIDRNGPMSHAWLMCTWLNEDGGQGALWQ